MTSQYSTDSPALLIHNCHSSCTLIKSSEPWKWAWMSPPSLCSKSSRMNLTHKHLSPIHTADADETKLFCRVASAVCTWIRDDCRRIRTHNTAVGGQFTILVTTAGGCVHTDDTTKLSPTSCEFVYTPPTRRDSTVSSRRRRRCVLGITYSHVVAITRTISILIPLTTAQSSNNLQR